MRRASSEPPQLPGYSFVKVLGAGGFSDVFLYEQKLPKRRVAVKVLLTEDLTAATRASFVAEANLMAQLSTHPYIVTIYQADVAADDRPYFVMEYCSGPSLAERYKEGTFAVADALRTGVRLSSAVATAHSAGILHRDIKPANVLTNDYGWPALTDFGISSAVDDELLPVHTGTLADALHDTGSGGTGSQSIGMSVPWSPPEMFDDDPSPDVRSDVFSLAATIYTILAGQTPFEVRGRSNGTLDLIGRIERGAVTPMPRDDLPRSLVAVLQKGMASQRDDRFATAVDFARALQRVELELGYAPTTIDVPNLFVDAPDRDAQADDADETRARGVATIEAQPLPVALPATARSDETQVRGAQRVDAQPAEDVVEHTVLRPRAATAVAEVPAEQTIEEPPRVSRRNRIVVWSTSAAAVLIAGAVTLGLVLSGGTPGGDARPTAKPGGTGSAVVGSVRAPTLVSVAPEGSTLVFTVKNGTAKDGDTFLWRRSDRGSSEPTQQTASAALTVKDYAAPATVCIEVRIQRDGQTGDPLDTCYPQ
jgi:serine/threonine protein kinase